MPSFMPVGNCCCDRRQSLSYAVNHVQGVGSGKDPDAHEGSGLAVEADILVVVLGSQNNVGNFAEPDDHAVLLLNRPSGGNLPLYAGRYSRPG